MPKTHKRSYRHLNQADRDRLQALRDEGVKQKEIARILKADPSTISREIARNRRKYREKKNIKNKNASYEASVADHKAYTRRKYAKYQGKNINENPDLRRYIIKKLKKYWSPDEIAGRMEKDKEPVYASKTAIYEWLRTVHGQRWCKYLYSRRYYKKKRKPKKPKKALIPRRIGIEHRPKGAKNRSRYGHYEGDAIVSAKHTASKAALSVVYERKARYIDAKKIKNLKPSANVNAINEMKKDKFVKTMTFDNGIENTKHEKLGVPSYFCDPYSSWQKGGVENANKMIRRFIPKKSDIADYSNDYIKMIVDTLNNKPRKSLNYKTPYEVMVEHNLFIKNEKSATEKIALRG